MLALFPLFFGLAIMELLAQLEYVPTYLLPAPSEIFKVLCFESQVWMAAAQSFYCALLGFFVSAVLGFLLGMLLHLSPLLKKMFYPYTVFFQTVPIIAIAPLLVIWIGYGSPTIVAAAVIVAVFPVISYSYAGLAATDPMLLDLFRLYGARKKDTYLRLRLPAALPQIFTGLRISAGLAVVGTLAGEWIAGGGLGGVIDGARSLQRIDLVFAAIFLAALLGLSFFAVLNIASGYFLRRYGKEKE